MTIKQFEQQLKKIHTDFRVVPHPTEEDVAGLYWRNTFVNTVPPKDIYPDKKPEYTDKYGHPYRTTGEITKKALQHLKNMQVTDFNSLYSV